MVLLSVFVIACLSDCAPPVLLWRGRGKAAIETSQKHVDQIIIVIQESKSSGRVIFNTIDFKFAKIFATTKQKTTKPNKYHFTSL
jgi:hypothetical protein